MEELVKQRHANVIGVVVLDISKQTIGLEGRIFRIINHSMKWRSAPLKWRKTKRTYKETSRAYWFN